MSKDGRLQTLRSLRFWLTPGMGVKRHVGLAVAGAFVVLFSVVAGMLWLLEGNRQLVSEPLERILVSQGWRRVGGWVSLAVLLGGMSLTVLAVRNLNRSLLSNWLPRPSEAAAVLHRRLFLSRGPRILALGGGTGLSNLLRGLRSYTSNLTAVVTVSDDGGSSGRLREAFGMPAPGDLSDCLAALSDNEVELGRLLEYRFTRGRELKGHTFGNLLLTTLTEVEGDIGKAVRAVNSLLSLSGSVYPVTAQPVTLEVVKVSGETVRGESRSRETPGAIRTVRLVPDRPRAVAEVVQGVLAAEIVVLGPGSLFTSTIPPLLVPDLRQALHETKAVLVYVSNIMTEAGETDGFSAFDHLVALEAHLGRYPDLVLVNTDPVDEARLRAYREEGADQVAFDEEPFLAAGVRVRTLAMLGSGPHAQHDSEKLARWLCDYLRRPEEAAA